MTTVQLHDLSAEQAARVLSELGSCRITPATLERALSSARTSEFGDAAAACDWCCALDLDEGLISFVTERGDRVEVERFEAHDGPETYLYRVSVDLESDDLVLAARLQRAANGEPS